MKSWIEYALIGLLCAFCSVVFYKSGHFLLCPIYAFGAGMMAVFALYAPLHREAKELLAELEYIKTGSWPERETESR